MSFESYCWSIGSTSFRVKDLNYKNEKLLLLLNEFWKNHSIWKKNQGNFYDLMKANGLVKGNAKIKDKDARQKTSGLHELGLVYKDRQITPVGQTLLNKEQLDNLAKDNIFGIESDSFLYLLQLLKMGASVDVDDSFDESCENKEHIDHTETNEPIKPFIRLLHLLCHFNYITNDEFTYILPLLAYQYFDNLLFKDIQNLRNKKVTIDDILFRHIMNMSNYKDSLKDFLQSNTNELISFSLMNISRKGTSYDENLFEIYKQLKKVIELKKNNSHIDLSELWELATKLKFKKYIFTPNSNKNNIKIKEHKYVLHSSLLDIQNEYQLRMLFFKINHLTRWKNTLKDYSDLNKRYFKLCDIISFKDDKIELDLFAKVFFTICFEKSKGIEYIAIKNNKAKLEYNGLYEITPLDQLLFGVPTQEEVLNELHNRYGIELSSQKETSLYRKNQRIRKLEKLIDDKFSNDNLLRFLDYFEKRGSYDEKLQAEITDNANIPTLFEYILAISWYKISGRKGNLLDGLNLSLDIDMLPKSHAVGGKADIVFHYKQDEIMPTHQLLIEATLSDSTSQRRMELEPVSRHLWHAIVESKCNDDYAILVSTNVHQSVISDFRGRKTMEMTFDDKNFINGMKILPINTKMIQFMLKENMTYTDVYKILNDAHCSELSLRQGWYNQMIESKFQ
ncbi:AlwI family type II restriction endonuclease [Lonepinella sp. BR2919]|uniref:AlwI family type II restriction endonuclease n=1 Tax=unclassified Lonepinella TaxID=2642006 RepID=UPI003F6DC66D